MEAAFSTRVSAPRRLAILCATLVLMVGPAFLGCVTTDKNGEIIVRDEPPAPKEPGRRKLSEVPIRPAWLPTERKVPLVLAGLPARAPAVHVIDHLPPVGNQGSQPSGTAWAVGYVALTVLARKEQGGSYRCSPAFVYNQLQRGNAGLEIHEAARLVATQGCASLSLMPYIESDYTTRPSPTALRQARSFKATGYGRVDFTDLNQVRAHLLQGSAVVVTMSITKNFVELDESRWAGPEGLYVGRHTVAIIGYDDRRREFLIQNSAGPDWGEKGYARIPYEWLVRLAGKAYVLW